MKLFRLDVPQRIGSLRCTAEGIPEVIPQQTINPQYAAPQVFDTLEAYIDFLISRQLRSEDIGADDVSRRRRETILTRFATELSRILARLSRPAHRRCVLSHDDLNHTNVLVDEAGGGGVSGVIDWEHQSTLPAVLAAQYPPYIRSGDSQIPAGDPEKWIEDSGMISPEGFSLTSLEDEASLLEFYANVGALATTWCVGAKGWVLGGEVLGCGILGGTCRGSAFALGGRVAGFAARRERLCSIGALDGQCVPCCMNAAGELVVVLLCAAHATKLEPRPRALYVFLCISRETAGVQGLASRCVTCQARQPQ